MDYKAFIKEVYDSIDLYESLNGFPANRTRELITHLQEVETLSRLMISPDLQQGFKVLRDAGKLDHTFEAIVVKYKEFFRLEIVEAAQWRLKNCNYLL